ncbi:RloB family protein [Actinomadura sp. 3N508]|uniref:RloB family protein n=1 Tax=Actinomadura sp. 3N508 TaxID=3375153 RepID=UPI00379C10BB
MCEGKTEKLYFGGMRQCVRRVSQLTVKEPGEDHLSLVRRAAEIRTAEYDEVWCVLDTELNDELVAKLRTEAERLDVNLALSAPSFEFWLILHLRDCSRPFQSAREAEKQLRAILPSWSKTATRFDDFESGVADACKRARRLHDGDGWPPNPSSGVWRLVENIRRVPGE